jgi:hypothetical protein
MAAPGQSEALPSPSLGKCSGLIFTSKLIDIFLDHYSPLLYPDQADISKCQRSLEVFRDENLYLWVAYHNLCIAIEIACMRRADEMAQRSDFHFRLRDFESEISWAFRGFQKMPKYDEYKAQQENFQLECRFGHRHTAHKSQAHVIPTRALFTPRDRVWRGPDGTPGFSAVGAMRSVVKQFLQVCPALESDYQSGRFHAHVRRAVDVPDDEIRKAEIQHLVRTINWRNEQLNWADNIVQQLQLKRPYEQGVRTWFTQLWEAKHEAYLDRYDEARKALDENEVFGVLEVGSTCHGIVIPWARPQQYVAAAMALSSRDMFEIRVRICQVLELRHELVRRLIPEVMKDPEVQEDSKEFLKMLVKTSMGVHLDSADEDGHESSSRNRAYSV